MAHIIKRATVAFIALVLTALVLILSASTASAQEDTGGGGGLLCGAPQPFQVGMQLSVLAGSNLPLSTTPGGQVLGYAPAGSVLYVFEGPQCSYGVNWWRVSVGEVVGWVPEQTDGNLRLTQLGSGVLCRPVVGTRLQPGLQARVTPGLPNVIRAQAGSGARLGLIPAGGVMLLINGPACANGDQWWWQVNYNGIVGWTGEADGYSYWLEPYTMQAGCSLAPRLQVGATGVVRPGLANVLRDRPGLNASGSTVIGSMPAAVIFSVTGGPVCQDGYQWWQVTVGGQTGWTAEGEGSTYWVEPVVCGNGMVARLAPGMRARVTPGLPNRMRIAPNTSAAVLDRIPAGATMTVQSDFACDASGRLWWLVSYNGTLGWTAEGSGGYYWLEPA